MCKMWHIHSNGSLIQRVHYKCVVGLLRSMVPTRLHESASMWHHKSMPGTGNGKSSAIEKHIVPQNGCLDKTVFDYSGIDPQV